MRHFFTILLLTSMLCFSANAQKDIDPELLCNRIWKLVKTTVPQEKATYIGKEGSTLNFNCSNATFMITEGIDFITNGNWHLEGEKINIDIHGEIKTGTILHLSKNHLSIEFPNEIQDYRRIKL